MNASADNPTTHPKKYLNQHTDPQDNNIHHSDPDLAIDVHNLNKYYDHKHVVDNLSLQVRKGEIFGFLGPNGSGKTTSIRMMCGLLNPDSGSGTCLGYDILTQREEIKKSVGYMTQRFSYWDDLSIRENLDFIARIYQIPNRDVVVKEAIDKLGLTGRANQMAGSLSGGWKQRLALAACMLHKPQLLLLDEPTAGVDPKARRDFWDEIHLLASQGIAVLVSTHYMDEAQRCNKLAYIAYGHLLAQGTPRDIIDSQHLTTWSISGSRLFDLSEELNHQPGVSQTIVFGDTLHVSGVDPISLEVSVRSIATAQKGYTSQKINTELEDVFIHLMDQAPDNFEETS